MRAISTYADRRKQAPTLAERREQVGRELRLNPARSDRRLARELGVSRQLVAIVRRELVKQRQIRDVPFRRGKDEKTYHCMNRVAKGETS
jgi:predicted transcriptional regulator